MRGDLWTKPIGLIIQFCAIVNLRVLSFLFFSYDDSNKVCELYHLYILY
jgi:hypothetical protein